MSTHGIKLEVSEGSVGGTLVGVSVGETYVSALGQEYVMCCGKEPVEVKGGGSGAMNIMEFWTMEVYAVEF